MLRQSAEMQDFNNLLQCCLVLSSVNESKLTAFHAVIGSACVSNPADSAKQH